MFSYYISMKIFPVSIFKRAIGTAAIAAGTYFLPAAFNLNAQERSLTQDTFSRVEKVPVSGTSDTTVLACAPSPKITVAGEKNLAAIVVDLSQNVLYHYNDKGEAVAAYLVASGKKSTPTDKGLRIVTHIESYPYKSAPAGTKRRRNPGNYGPRIICLETVNPKTGARGKTGEFIHGNSNPKTLGKYASLGCIRMDNEVIKKLAREIKRGAFVLIK